MEMKSHYYRLFLEVEMDFSRQIILPQLGESGQEKLRKARVLLVGAGGLGSAILPYLAAAGVGTLGIMDGDLIAASNLHRQLLYSENQVGLLKVKEAKKYLETHFPELKVQIFEKFLDSQNAKSTLENFDLIIDATDEIQARYILNDVCEAIDIPWVYGSVHQFQGQVSVFNYKNGPNYRDLFPSPDPDAVSCSDAGVIGTTVGLIGMLQANEAIKILAGFGTVLSGKILIYDLLSSRQEIYDFEKTPEREEQTEQISFTWISIPEAIQSQILLLDVREENEKPYLSGENYLQIPLSIFAQKTDELDPEKQIGIFCQTGKRSQRAAHLLHQRGFTQIRLLKGGAKELSEQLKHEKDIS